ncbi:amidohydrolase family protein [Elioraea rosea]|uniref:amidohydrolase family protein n=1 Tax=Elioraea rosea TaxID=2492390 RepID=UPI00118432ED|nr:amidohydrolase family protein [Elioraea rosea]
MLPDEVFEGGILVIQVHGLRAKWVLAHDGRQPAILDDATVVIDGSTIAAILSPDQPQPPLMRDLGESLLMPGLINAHSHCVSGPLFRGVMEDRQYESQGQLIDRVMIPLGEIVTELCDEDDIRKIAALGQLEVLKSGTTMIIDMPRAGHDGFGLAVREIGLRAYVHPFLASPTGASWAWNDGADSGVEHVLATFHRWHARFDQGSSGRVRVGLGPLAPNHCTPSLLRGIARTRDAMNAAVTVHLAQSPEEIALITDRFGMSSVVYLDRLGLLQPGLIAAHCVFASPEDLRLMAARGVAVAHCPLAYARLGTLAARSRFTAEGVTALIGTDAHAHDLLADVRLASINSKYDSKRQGAANAWELITAVTEGAAEVIGRDDLGRIAPGAQADLVAYRLDGAHVQPVHDPVTTLVWNGSGRDTGFVMVAGEVLVEDGRFTRFREQDIIAAGSATIGRAWARAVERNIIERRR